MLRPEVETERLRLRQFRPDDLEELAAIRADPVVMRFIGKGTPYSLEDTRWSLERKIKIWEERGFGQWAVTFKDEPQMLGWCGLDLLDTTEEIEVGWGLARPFWGQGIATEAARAALSFAFETLRLERIVAVAMLANTASHRVMQKIGMKYVRDAFFYEANVVYYAVTREEFLNS
jgi:RimJ/RimL family protein N-acetyltransferase